MSLHVSLFGKFCVQVKNIERNIDSQKAQELFFYLLIYRNRPHFREKLANILWQNSSTSRAKQYLRQSLWELQSAIGSPNHDDNGILLIESDWIRINDSPIFWLDIADFEDAFDLVKGIHGYELDDAKINTLQQAVHLYQGDLLENWYQDWCIFERERLQNMYLIMLDKLMGYCEFHQEFEKGIIFGSKILYCDRTRERTYRRLMRLRYLAGDRTGAIHEFKRCVAILDKELSISPGRNTLAIYRQIQNDEMLDTPISMTEINDHSILMSNSLSDLLLRLGKLRFSLLEIQHNVESDMEMVMKAMRSCQ